MNSIFAELNRRGVLRTGSAYIVLSWLMLQVSGILVPAMELPPVVLTVTGWFLIFCFPFVVLASWLIDVTPEGIVLTRTLEQQAVQHSQNTEVARSVIDLGTSPTSFAAQSLLSGQKSIAVLPFVDMSTQQDQGHLADGVAEEIRNRLSATAGLHVIGRSSSKAFASKRDDAREIGKMLHVQYVLAGSISRAADKLSVKARLIRVDSGFQLWATSYDRNLKDIFDVQEEIAITIAQELGLSTNITKKEDTPQRLTGNEGAYSLYMRARNLMTHRIDTGLEEAISLLEQALKIDDNFARAWAALAEAHVASTVHLNKRLSEAQAAAERCCRKAIAIDQSFAAPHAVLGRIFMQHRAYTAMQESLNTALALDADDTTALHHAGMAMISVGRLSEASQLYQRLHDIDPMMPFALSGMAISRLLTGDLDAAEGYASRVAALGFGPALLTLADIAWLRQDLEKAAELQDRAMKSGLVHEFTQEQISILSRSIYFEDRKEEALYIVDEYVRDPAPETEGFAPVMLLRLGRIEEAFDIFARNKFAFDSYFLAALWSPSAAEARQHPSFRDFVKRIGLVDYWQQYGWAHHFKPVSDTDFEVV
ncbi:MAG: FlgO family outer membrane protein [Aquisalinus sp.]|nr:FlgO family outer membrane protein [Aquisalinus sp.]